MGIAKGGNTGSHVGSLRSVMFRALAKVTITNLQIDNYFFASAPGILLCFVAGHVLHPTVFQSQKPCKLMVKPIIFR
jgi:hypothetical protein